MADKTIRLKYVVETQVDDFLQQSRRIITLVEDQEKSLRKVITANKLVREQQEIAKRAYSELTEKIQRYQERLDEGGRKASSVFYNSQQALEKYNATIDETNRKLASIRNNLSLGAAPSNSTSPRTPQATFTRSAATGAIVPTAPSASQQAAKNAKELDTARKALGLVTAEQDRHTDALGRSERAYKSLAVRIVEAVSIYRVYNAAVNTVKDAILSIPDVGIKLEAVKSTLAATIGGETAVGSTLKALERESQRTGIEISTLRENFRLFSASALSAGESLDTTYRIFTNVNTAVTALHQSSDLTQHTFLAFAQILNKGKVQSEELVKQLGNLLPAAFNTMAKALGISSAELSRRMKQGLVTAHDSLDAFAREYALQFEKAFIVASQGLNAGIGRLKTSFTLLSEAVYAQTSGSLNDFTNLARKATDEVRFLVEGTSKYKDTLEIFGTIINGIAIVSISAFIAKIFRVSSVMAPMVGTIGLGTVALAKLKSAFSFLSIPTAIVTGIVLIEEKLRGIIFPAETLVEKLRKSKAEAEELAKKNKERESLSKPGQLTFDIENSAEITAQKKQIKDVFDEIRDARNALDDNKFNPFFSANDAQKARDTIRENSAFLKVQFADLEELRKAKRLELEADQIAADLKQKDFDGEENLGKQKEINFSNEVRRNSELLQQEEQKYKAKLKTLELEQKLFESRTKDKSATIPEADVIKATASFEQRRLALEEDYAKKRVSIIDASFKEISGLASKESRTLANALEVIKDIESSGKVDAVSNKAAIGLRQVLPSTLASPGLGLQGIKVPQNILDIEQSAKTKELTDKQKETLRQYAIDNVEILADFGVRYYKALVKRYEGDLTRAAAAYNAGFGNEDKGIRPPETRSYVSSFDSRLAKKGLSSENFTNIALDLETKKQSELDSIREAGLNRTLVLEQKRVDNANLLFERLKAENEAAIEYNELVGNTEEAERDKITAEFREREAAAIKMGSEFLLRRLPVIKQERLLQADISAIREKYNKTEEKYQNDLQNLANKSATGQLNFNNGLSQSIALQQKYISDQIVNIQNWEKLAALSNNVKDNQDAANARQQLKNQLAQGASVLNNPIGAFGEAKQAYETRKQQIDSAQVDEQGFATLQFQEDLANNSLTAYQDYYAALANIEDKSNQQRLAAQSAFHASTLESVANNIGGLVSLSQYLYGEQSKQARIAFAAQKAFLAAQAIMTGEAAVLDAFKSGSQVNIYLGYANAALAAIFVAGKVASILSQPLPSAHGGLTNVPAEQTYLLNKGERVLSPNQNKDFTDDLSRRRSERAQQKEQNIRIVNVMDESLVYSALGSDQGERIIMNIVNKNK